jgi:glucokinase
MTDLIGDIGGTNARFALVEAGEITASGALLDKDYSSFQAAIETFLAANGTPKIRAAAFAFAGPITGDTVKLTNLPTWNFSQTQLRQALGFERLSVVNDFYANALSLSALKPEHLYKVGGGTGALDKARIVIGPGSGLGIAIVAHDCGRWIPLPGEGGHATLSLGRTAREDAIYTMIRDRYQGVVSIERILSGPGLVNLYQAICEVDGIQSLLPDQRAITTLAIAGSDPVALETLTLFFSLLGAVAGNLALTAMARGGIYIAGGIVPALLPQIEASPFRACFAEKGRMQPLLEDIPTFVITHPHPAFVGLTQLLADLPAAPAAAG